MQTVLLIWLVCYVAPVLIAGSITKLLPAREHASPTRNLLIMHAALLLSICASQYAIYQILGSSFPWNTTAPFVGLFAVGVLFAFWLLGYLGIWYGFSALAQQITMLSSTFILLTVFSVPVTILLIVPLFVFCHPLRVKQHVLLRITLMSLWGIISIFLFSVLHNIWLIAAMHTIFGAFLVSRSILYPDQKDIHHTLLSKRSFNAPVK